ncbi:MAG TPA: DUF1844 domain-containing protein [Fimbriimonas sp.]|nr:DUF1844 domain-containing protein [Fimbriimonas sp.]
MSEEFQERKSPSIHEILAVVLDQLAGVAWQKLGLQPDMVTGKMEQDLVQAKVAVDVVAYLSNIIESEVDEEDRRQLQNLVRDLKINYVQRHQA